MNVSCGKQYRKRESAETASSIILGVDPVQLCYFVQDKRRNVPEPPQGSCDEIKKWIHIN